MSKNQRKKEATPMFACVVECQSKAGRSEEVPRAKEEIIERATASRVPDESLQGSETILLVEDQSELRNFTCEFLQRLGYKVLDAGFPGEAIQITKQFTGQIDLLLADVVMPGMSGRELAKQLRPSYANMRVLYISGFADPTCEQDVLDANEAFLAKPFFLREPATKIRELFRDVKSASCTEQKQSRAS
jgi:two-component system, cell cycle sensor histidine kinase and response regulator CckA